MEVITLYSSVCTTSKDFLFHITPQKEDISLCFLYRALLYKYTKQYNEMRNFLN